MGSTTLYHPVSLYVLRGSVIWGGFKLGKIQQLNANLEKGTARYRSVLVQVPDEIKGNLPAILATLRACFMYDVEVTGIWKDKHGQTVINFTTQITTQEYGQRHGFPGEEPNRGEM